MLKKTVNKVFKKLMGVNHPMNPAQDIIRGQSLDGMQEDYKAEEFDVPDKLPDLEENFAAAQREIDNGELPALPEDDAFVAGPVDPEEIRAEMLSLGFEEDDLADMAIPEAPNPEPDPEDEPKPPTPNKEEAAPKPPLKKPDVLSDEILETFDGLYGRLADQWTSMEKEKKIGLQHLQTVIERRKQDEARERMLELKNMEIHLGKELSNIEKTKVIEKHLFELAKKIVMAHKYVKHHNTNTVKRVKAMEKALVGRKEAKSDGKTLE